MSDIETAIQIAIRQQDYKLWHELMLRDDLTLNNAIQLAQEHNLVGLWEYIVIRDDFKKLSTEEILELADNTNDNTFWQILIDEIFL